MTPLGIPVLSPAKDFSIAYVTAGGSRDGGIRPQEDHAPKHGGEPTIIYFSASRTGLAMLTVLKMIFRVARMGTARKIPGIPHTQPQKRIEIKTTVGFIESLVLMIAGVMKLPSRITRARYRIGGRRILVTESKESNETRVIIVSVVPGPR